MKRRIYVLLITLLLCIGALPIFSSCSESSDPLADYTVVVTYYFNGGKMETYESRTYLGVNYKPGTPIVEPGKTGSLKEVYLSGYYAAGWYYAELDEGGNVRFDADGNAVASDKKFDFSTERPTESLSLVVKWDSTIRVIYKNLTFGTMDFYTEISEGDELFKPSFKQTGDKKTVRGYYWVDQTNGVFPADQAVDFGSGISMSELRTHLPDNPEMDGNYILLYIYVDVE
jgi:hypothetical protein